MHHLLEACGLDILLVCLEEYPVNAGSQILGIPVVGYIAIPAVVYHLRNASHLESYARHSTCHGFHDGIRKILRQGRQDEYVCRIINVNNALILAYIAQGNGWERQFAFEILTMTAKDCHAGIVPHLRIGFAHHLAGFYQIIHSLVRIGRLLGNEQYDVFILRQKGTQACLLLVFRTVEMRIYRIRNGFYPLTGKKSAELCLGSQPAAAGYERNASSAVHFLFFLPDTGR